VIANHREELQMAASSANLNRPNIQPHAPGAPWSVQSAAAYLGISERHLIYLCDAETIRSFRIGRRRLIADAELRRIAEGG
jgi:excisionase family DNA binding protein